MISCPFQAFWEMANTETISSEKLLIADFLTETLFNYAMQ
jgi:hypothetical protein